MICFPAKETNTKGSSHVRYEVGDRMELITIKPVSQILNETADIIEREGFIIGSAGWLGYGGFCAEGALFKAITGMAISPFQLKGHEWRSISRMINLTDAGVFLREYLNIGDNSICCWNDQHPQKGYVISKLRAAALVAQLQESPEVPKRKYRVFPARWRRTQVETTVKTEKVEEKTLELVS